MPSTSSVGRRVLRQAIHCPTSAWGRRFVRVHEVENAVHQFKAALEIFLKLGRRDDALKVAERLLQHRADSAFARAAAEIYLDRGEPSDAMAALTKLQICFRDNPKDLDTLGLLARAFDALGQPAKAIEVQKEAARIAKETGTRALPRIGGGTRRACAQRRGRAPARSICGRRPG